VIGAFADLALLSTDNGELRSSMHTPCRSLPARRSFTLSSDFWDDVAEVHIAPGQAFELCYPNHVVALGTITSVFPVTPA